VTFIYFFGDPDFSEVALSWGPAAGGQQCPGVIQVAVLFENSSLGTDHRAPRGPAGLISWGLGSLIF